MLCEIINPSDKYTLRTDDFTLAAVAIGFLGNGKLGLVSQDGKLKSPVFFGWDDWFKEQGITDLIPYINEHAAGIADVLDSVLIGGYADRADCEAATAQMDKKAANKFLAERHNRHRSSMNDIGAAAWSLAVKLRLHLDKVKTMS